MWLFDIYHDVYSHDMGRRFYIAERSGDDNLCYSGPIPVEFSKPRFSRRRSNTSIYTVVEEWETPNSKGDTGEFDYYTFMTYQDAAVFIAELCMKLNSPMQRKLLRAADDLASDICREHEKATTEIEAGGLKLMASKQVVRAPLQKKVYIFGMCNDTVKIGVSNQIGQRKKVIQNSSGMDIVRCCYSRDFPAQKAFNIECALHRHFATYRTKGEFFKISFEQARDELQHYSKITEETITAK